ncbi:hypothetical protein LPJ55_000622 [Coemansia sp. RSA 990]|nr:hypothetical protein LPJ55_000622 [Coemansia sp. RSA 990]
MLRIPKDVAHMYRRQDESGDESTTPESSSAKEKPSSHESPSPSPTPEKSSSEEGALESDSPDPEASGDNNENNDNDSDNSNGENSDQGSQDIPTDAPTDAQGNPIITDVNVSYWSLIQPTGVSYMSGASKQTAGRLGIMGALVVAAMF